MKVQRKGRTQVFFASAIAIIFLFLGAGGVVGQLQESLNTIWRVVPKGGRGGQRVFAGPFDLLSNGVEWSASYYSFRHR